MRSAGTGFSGVVVSVVVSRVSVIVSRVSVIVSVTSVFMVMIKMNQSGKIYSE